MFDGVAGARRSARVLAVVVGMLVALFTACCCLELGHASIADPVPAAHVAAQAGASHDVIAGRDGGHTEKDCQDSVAALAVGSPSVPGPLVVPVAFGDAPMAGPATPRVGAPRPEAQPPPPVPHLLCVMRT